LYPNFVLENDTDFRAQLEARINRYASQRDQLNSDLIDLNHALNSLEKRLDAAVEMFRLEFDEDPPSLPAPTTRPQRRGPIAKPDGQSWNGTVEAVLADAGEPLHINEIWRRMQQRGFQTTAKDPLRAIASVLVRHPEAIRTQPNTYGLANGDRPQQSLPPSLEEPGDPSRRNR
jgi:hypothetical protein